MTEFLYYVDKQGNYYINRSNNYYVKEVEVESPYAFYKHKAYIKGKPYYCFIRINGQLKRVRPVILMSRTTSFSTKDNQQIFDIKGEEFIVKSADDSLIMK